MAKLLAVFVLVTIATCVCNAFTINPSISINQVQPLFHAKLNRPHHPHRQIHCCSRPLPPPVPEPPSMDPTLQQLTKLGFVMTMLGYAVAMPVLYAPLYALETTGVLDRPGRERWAIRGTMGFGEVFNSVVPFIDLQLAGHFRGQDPILEEDGRVIWAMNHVSSLDVFVGFAAASRMAPQRQFKIVYWQGLTSNPLWKLIADACGFIPVNMEANDIGAANEYQRKGMKEMFRACKRAINEGFDIAILPEGQPNISPESGRPGTVYPGAARLAKVCRVPICLIATHGIHRIWHAEDGLENYLPRCERRDVVVHVCKGRKFDTPEEFETAFVGSVTALAESRLAGEAADTVDLDPLWYATTTADTA